MTNRNDLLSTTAMVPQRVQLWQAEAVPGAVQQPTPEPEIKQEQQTESAADVFSDMFAELAKDDTQPTIKADVFSDMFAELAKDDTQPTIKEGGDGGNDGAAGGDKGKSADTSADAGNGAVADGTGAGGGLPDPAKVAADAVKALADAEAAKKAGTQQEPPKAAVATETKPAAQPIPDEAWNRFAKIMTEAGTAKPDQQQQPEPAGPQYTKEELALVDAYQKEWPEIHQAELLMRREENRALVGYIFGQVSQQFGPVLRDLVAFAQSTGAAQHIQQVQEAIPDYSAIRDKVVSWVDTQPPMMKAAYGAVVKQGSPEDVAALVETWRKATGEAVPTKQQPQGGGQGAAPDRKAQEQGQNQPQVVPKNVLDNLKPVGGRRTNVQAGGIDKGDFDGAFEAFAKTG